MVGEERIPNKQAVQLKTLGTMEINYSIIIPHHNESALLQRLLSTIPNRADLEIIVVDDASTENEVKELTKLENSRSDLKIIYHNTNIGGGGARNIGLSFASGRYVIFSDSDDFFLPSLNKKLEQYRNYFADLIVFNAISLDSEKYLNSNRASHLNSLIKRYNKTSRTDEIRYLFGEPWCKFINRKMIQIHNIRFDQLPIHNDTTFSLFVGHYAKNVTVDDTAIYCITERAHSVSKSITLERIYVRADVFFKKNIFLQKHKISFRDRLLISAFYEMFKMKGIDGIKELNHHLGISLLQSCNIITQIVIKEISRIL